MFDKAEQNLKQLSRGAFLVTGNENANVMTIGWGFVGYMWKKKVFIAPVRKSRYSHEIIEQTGTFTISIPSEGTFKDELKYVGTKSGRDVDKFASSNLKKLSAPLANSFVIADCNSYYQCKVIGKLDLDNNLLSDEAKVFYSDGDMHTLYFGEILE